MEVRLILFGFGTVGQGLARILTVRSQEIQDKYGISFKLVAVADRKGGAVSMDGLDPLTLLSIKNLRGSVSEMPLAGRKGLSAIDLLNNVEGDIFIELTTSNLENGEPGITHIKEALSHNIDVVTANKGAIGRELNHLKTAAEHHNQILRYGAAVGGGIPILTFAKDIEAREGISSIQGVFNGTSNYILSKMERGYPFKEALTEAQKCGYAEQNSNYDITGLDSACKLTILANSVLNLNLKIEDVIITGIERLTTEYVTRVKSKNSAIRLIGSLKRDGQAEVHPKVISRNDPLCVESINNVVKITTRFGTYTLIGKGAGGQATACSLLGELIEAAMGRLKNVKVVSYL